MKRLPLLLVPFLLASCDGGGSTDPDELVESLDLPRFYVGTARTQQTTNSQGTLIQASFTGTVRFGTTDRGAPPVDYAMVSGTMMVTHSGSISGCTVSGGKSFDLGPGDGVIVLFPGGRFSGNIRKEVESISKVTCSGQSADVPLGNTIQLEIQGTANEGRMQGTMVPYSVGGTTWTGSWDFAPANN